MARRLRIGRDDRAMLSMLAHLALVALLTPLMAAANRVAPWLQGTVRVTVCDRHVELDRRGLAGYGRQLASRRTLFAVEVDRG